MKGKKKNPCKKNIKKSKNQKKKKIVKKKQKLITQSGGYVLTLAKTIAQPLATALAKQLYKKIRKKDFFTPGYKPFTKR